MTVQHIRIFTKIPPLYTDRLTLRRMTVQDSTDVYEYASDPEVSKYLLWTPHPSVEYTRYYLSYLAVKYKKGQYFNWGVGYQGKIIGTCGFSSFDIENNSAHIGYVLNRRYWGMGIAAEAAQRVINFGFDTLELERIEVRYISGNTASARVAQKCGMTYEGRLRSAIKCKGEYCDLEIYSITRNEYFKKL